MKDTPLKSYVALGILSVLFLITTFMLILSVRERIIINKKMKKTLAAIGEYTKTGKPPVLMRLADLLSQRLTLNEKYNKLKHTLNRSSTKIMPVEPHEYPLKFKEQLYQTHQRLKNLAANSDVSLPDDLGFNKLKTQIPAIEQLPVLVKQLNIVDEIIRSLMAADIKKIDSVELIEPTDKPTAVSETIYKELPVRVTVECETSNLVKFLYALRTSEFIFIIRSLKIDAVGQQPGKIKVELKISYMDLL